jgi:hypothetical protein
MKNVLLYYREIVSYSKDTWKNNRKEFWELWRGYLFIILWFLFTFFVLLRMF